MNRQTNSPRKNLRPRAGRIFLRLLGSFALIAAVTYLCYRVFRVNAASTGFFYLVVILAIATAWGFLEATVTSVVAMLCYNYFFFPPVGTFTVTDPQNWVALFAFLATSLTASQLSAWAKRRTREAVDRQREIERLYTLSRAILLTDSSQPTGKQIARQIAGAFELPAVALFDRTSGEIYSAGPESLPDAETRLREAVSQSSLYHDAESLLTVAPIRLGGEPIGALAVRGIEFSDAALQSLLNLVAVGLEKDRAQAAVTRAEVSRQSEELKSTLLDAVAHEFKTPLTSIKAVTTDLLSNPESPLGEPQRELVTVADEAADRLARLVTEAIQLARIEGGKFHLNREVHFPSSLIWAAVRQMKPLTTGREVVVDSSDDLPFVFADAELIRLVICHLLENAVKYTPAGTPITVRACAASGAVVLSVADRGPGVSPVAQARIFDKYYRGEFSSDSNRSRRPVLGTGMGLAIAREIVQAHGGEIWVTSATAPEASGAGIAESKVEGGPPANAKEPAAAASHGVGAEFCFTLPVAAQEKIA